jgi:serine/threonine protein kinase
MSGQPTSIGRYEVQQRLGQGGMGAIYLARDPAIDRLVAVKLLKAEIASDDLRRRFAQEARASGALSHPHIVTIHDFGEVDGAPFIVMEYVRGETLAEIVKRAATVTVVRKLRWIEQVCSALGYAHQRRVIHRDVKPSNLMVDEEGLIRVVDFGIARIVGGSLTKMSTVIGTPGYMSPEQLQGGAIDSRSDIFAVGAVLYELLSYREAFQGDTPHAIMHRVITADPPPLTELLSGPDLSVIGVIETALQKSPDARYADMAELEAAIARARVALEASGHEIAVRATRRAGSDLNRSKRRRTDPVDIARRRAEQIEHHLHEARQAHDAGDNEAAIEACERVLLMDPSSVPALDLLEDLRQEDTGVVSDITRPVAPMPPPRARATVRQEPPTVPAPSVSLSDVELLPRNTEPMAPVRAVDLTATVPLAAPSNRRGWLLAGAAGLALVAATAAADVAGIVDLGIASVLGLQSDPYVELAMPAPTTAPTPAPPPRNPPARSAAPSAPQTTGAPVEAPTASATPTRAEPPTAAVEAAPAAPTDPAPPTAPALPPAPSAVSGPAPAPPEPPKPEPAKPADTPAVQTETVEKDAAAAAPDTPVSRARREVGRLLLRAEAAEGARNTSGALALYREVLQLDPKNAIASRGVTRMRVDFLLRRAESQILVGDYEGALNDINTVSAEDPKNPRAAELREAIEQGKKTRKKPR